mmetsp:Transcript_11324/g.25756  ORF Transcript_11324/g.25756 Transcript_11324/m.25756 type:complete len:213 (+) Transcript_11324:529-1167(+)
MPSSTAARVALSASVSLSFFSPTSTSEAPPTLITAIPPESLARRSCSFSRSYSEVVASMESRMIWQRSSMAALLPWPSRRMVSSLEIVAFFTCPSIEGSTDSIFSPRSSEMTVPPVRTAISCMLALRLSPKPGAFTAQTLRPPRSLFTIRAARASDSTSSAITTRGLPTLAQCSRMGKMLWKLDTFFSQRRTMASSNSHFWFLGLEIKYGEM